MKLKDINFSNYNSSDSETSVTNDNIEFFNDKDSKLLRPILINVITILNSIDETYNKLIKYINFYKDNIIKIQKIKDINKMKMMLNSLSENFYNFIQFEIKNNKNLITNENKYIKIKNIDFYYIPKIKVSNNKSKIIIEVQNENDDIYILEFGEFNFKNEINFNKIIKNIDLSIEYFNSLSYKIKNNISYIKIHLLN